MIRQDVMIHGATVEEDREVAMIEAAPVEETLAQITQAIKADTMRDLAQALLTQLQPVSPPPRGQAE